MKDSPSSLFEHLDHLGLEDVVYGLDSDCRSGLRHGKDVDNLNSVFIHKLSEHQTHNLHGYTRSAVFEHLENRNPFSVFSSMKCAEL